MYVLKTSVLFLVAVCLGMGVTSASAQGPAVQRPDAPRTAGASTTRLDGPAAPVAPEVVTRDTKGRATLRAVRITTPLVIDGHLDEAVYSQIKSAGNWVQQLPVEGVPATEPSEMWVFFDDKNLYIAVRCMDAEPGHQIATELRRDNNGIVRNDSLSFSLDTFYDRRNGFNFQTTPIGTVRDQAAIDNVLNESWNTVWEVKSSQSDAGWTTELAIPFKSLRYSGAGPQVWGFNARRIRPWKNEISTLSAVPASYGTGAGNRLNVAGTLVGLETPQASNNLEVKPYAISSLADDKTAAVPYTNDLSKDAGFDFKYGLTRSMIFDATVHTDFAQVEEDLQQVNLTRFSLFFPEKRDFFLEGQGIFAFGGGQLERSSGTDADIPVLFFSRQIGLYKGLAVPVIAGGRLTGRAGKYTVGAINVETDDHPASGAVKTNFSALRLKRNIFRRSNVGLIATTRTPSGGGQSNTAGGVDAAFSFYQNLSFSGYFAKTTPSDKTGSDSSYRGRFDYTGDRYGFEAEHLMVGEAFDPQVGSVRRTDFRRTYSQARFSPRTRRSKVFRRLSWDGSIDYVSNAPGTVVMNRDLVTSFTTELNSSDSMKVEYDHTYEFIPKKFAIAPGVIVPQGGYDGRTAKASYTLGQQHLISGTVKASHGTLYNGTRTDASYSGYIGLNAHFAFEPSATLAWVDLPGGSFTARVLSMRTIVTPTARMLLSSLVQFNAASHALSSSVRLRWEYRPGSEFFVVYSDGRSTLGTGVPDLLNRSLAVKVTKLLRF